MECTAVSIRDQQSKKLDAHQRFSLRIAYEATIHPFLCDVDRGCSGLLWLGYLPLAFIASLVTGGVVSVATRHRYSARNQLISRQGRVVVPIAVFE